MSIYIELTAQQIATCDLSPLLSQREDILSEGICEIFADPDRYTGGFEDDHELFRYCSELLRAWPGLTAHCESAALSFLAQALGVVVGHRIISKDVVDDLRLIGKPIPNWLLESFELAKAA